MVFLRGIRKKRVDLFWCPINRAREDLRWEVVAT